MHSIEQLFNQYQDIGSLLYKKQKDFLEKNNIQFSFNLKNKKVIKNNNQEYIKLNKLSYKYICLIKKDDTNINLRLNSNLFILFFDEKYKIKINDIDFTYLIQKYDIDIINKFGYFNNLNIEDVDQNQFQIFRKEIEKSINQGIIKIELKFIEFSKKRQEFEINQNIYNNNYWILQEINKMKEYLINGNKSIEKMKMFLNDEAVELVKKEFSNDIYYIFKYILNIQKPRLLTEEEINKIEFNDIFKIRKKITFLKAIKMINSKFFGVFQTNHYSKKHEKILKLMNLSLNDITTRKNF